MAGLLGLVNEVPFVSGASNVTKLLSEGPQGDYARGELVKNTVVPIGVQDVAKWTDQHTANGEPVKRAPQTLLQHVESGIPGLRENVPYATRTREDRKNALAAMTPPQRAQFFAEEQQVKARQRQRRAQRQQTSNVPQP